MSNQFGFISEQTFTEKMDTNNAFLATIASAVSKDLRPDSLKEIQSIVGSGLADKVFRPGDQIIVPWKDIAKDVTYDIPFNVVHFGDVTLKTGEVVPGMYLQMDLCTADGVQFDNYEAFYEAEEGLEAGTYYVTMGFSWGSSVINGKSYQFTLTNPVPAGGKLRGFYRAADVSTSEWKVESFKTAFLDSKIESVSVEEGTDGTFLGRFTTAGDETINSLHRVGYGYNRWGHSATRKYLNSREGVGKWWNPENKFDMAPDQLTTLAGFMSGFDEEFLSILSKVKVTTALNTVTDSAIGVSEDTYDTFFLPSLEQIYATPQLNGVEGEAFEYWKRALELTEPAKWHPNTYDAYKVCALNAKTSPQTVRLRSATRGSGCNAWYQFSGGYLYGSTAIYANRLQPACVITGIGTV